MFQSKIKLLSILLVLLLSTTNAYKIGDPIKFAVNKVAPYNNPAESYKYYDLPFCRSESVEELSISIPEGLSGNRRFSSSYQTNFGINEESTSICDVQLSEAEVQQFREAVENNYIFEMFIDDVVVGSTIGLRAGSKYYLSTHLNFIIFYNKEDGNIIKATVEADQSKGVRDITENSVEDSFTFTYSVTWNETPVTVPVTNKGNDSFFTQENHGLSFLSGLILNTSLFFIVTLIFQKMQISESNYQFSDIESEKRDSEFIWKSIRNEVYRTPGFRSFLCAFVGTGMQLIATIITVLVLGGLGYFTQTKGSVATAALASYLVASLISGLFSGLLYNKIGGQSWHVNTIFTALAFPLPATIISGAVNNIAWIGGLTSALPFQTILILYGLWLLIAAPLATIGGYYGGTKSSSPLADTSNKPLNPNKKFNDSTGSIVGIFSVLLAGLFTFSVFRFELYYIFTAIWGHKIYVAYGTLLVIFVLSLNVAVATSIIFTYFQLNNRDFKWWWKSFLYGGSSAIYIFCYAVYYYLKRSQQSGFVQSSFYFGYSALMAFVAFIVFGTAGFLGTSAFIRQSYERRKMD